MPTIAEIAPQKFVYQHQASLLFGHLCGDDFELVIEPTDGEDALVHLAGGSGPIDLQIKNIAGTVDEHAFGSMLAHFAPHGASCGLIDTLLADNDRCVVFMFSARVSDAIAPLVITPDQLPPRARSTNPIKGTGADELIEAFVHAWATDGTKLDAARHAHCNAIVARIGAGEFKRLLRRVFVLENLRASQVEDEIAILLTRTYGVPSNERRRRWRS